MSDLIVERHDRVMLLRFNRPERHNAIGGTLLAELLAAVEEAGADDAIGAVVTTGQGATYCVGGDLDEMDDQHDHSAAHLLNSSVLGGDKGMPALSAEREALEDLGIGRWVLKFRELEKPTIAALNGPVAGGGLALALLHDFRYAARSMRATTGFVKVGVAPELGMSHLLPRLVGWQAATELLLRGNSVDPAEALRIGLVDRVLETDELLDASMALAAEISAHSSASVQLTKRLLRSSADSSFEQQLRREYQAQVLLFSLPATRKSLAAVRSRVTGGKR